MSEAELPEKISKYPDTYLAHLNLDPALQLMHQSKRLLIVITVFFFFNQPLGQLKTLRNAIYQAMLGRVKEMMCRALITVIIEVFIFLTLDRVFDVNPLIGMGFSGDAHGIAALGNLTIIAMVPPFFIWFFKKIKIQDINIQ